MSERTEVPSHIAEAAKQTEMFVPPTVPRHGPTDKQRDFIFSLLEQTGHAAEDYPVTSLTSREASELINSLLKEREEKSPKPNGSAQRGATHRGPEVASGTYTVVFNDSPSEEDRLTVRFRSPAHGKWMNVQLVEYLYGPDNETSYRRYGNRTKDGYRVWSQYVGNERLVEALTHLMGNPTMQADAGLVYSLRSSRCFRCNRKLTVPVSIHRGLGPECAKQVG
jgi:hypothetical protein